MDYKVNGTDLTSVANAIRTKGGTSSPLSFPDGFVDAIGDISGGGSATLITKSITANGTYNASSDSADGYSSVTVAVPSRLIMGTFESEVAATRLSVSIPYTGSGYPIAGVIIPTEGSFKTGSTIEQLIQNYAIYFYAFSKNDISATPTYNADSSENRADVILMCKYGTAASGVTDSKAHSVQIYNTSDSSGTAAACIRFKDATTMNVFIANTSYGFKENVEYTYYIVYSS